MRAEGPALFGLPVAAALLAGVLLVQAAPALPPWPWLLPGLVVAVSLLRARGGWRLLGAGLFGILLAAGHGRLVLDQRLPPELAGVDVTLEGRVVGLPVALPESTRFDFLVEGGEGDAVELIGRTLRLGWYGPTEGLDAGSHWRLSLRLRPPRGVLNPGGHDFERRALEQRLAATGYVRAGEGVRRLAGGAGMDHVRARLSARIAEALPEDRARFIQALALGDTRGLSQHDWEVLRITGLTHLIAISGFHVGLVAGFGALLAQGVYRLLPALGRRMPRPLGAAAAALVCAAAYTGLAGFALPTVRTLLMIAVVALARGLRRPVRGGDALALALIAVLLADPLSILAPGFWLSFVGVAWLLWCLPAQPGAAVLRPFLESQGVAVLGLLPLSAWYFAQASVPGPLTNLIGIPVISLGVVPLALMGLLLDGVSMTAAGLVWRLAASLMDALWMLLEQVAAWPAALVWLPEPGLAAVVLALAGAFWLLLPRAVPGKALALCLFLPLLWPRLELPAHGEAELVMLDVGQGLSVLVRTRSHALLYDAGPAPLRGLDMGESAVVPALRALAVHQLDLLMLSHGDNDHAGGAAAVRAAFPASRLMAPEALAMEGASACERGGRWEWDGVTFEVLHPPALFPYLRNESSCVLRVEAGGSVALLPGDIGRHVERRLLREQPRAIAADLLLAPHHGSDTSSSGDFIEAVAPGLVLFAVGADNRFRLPKADVVGRYRALGAELADSAGSGALRVRLGAGGARLTEAYRRDRPRYWRHAAPTGSGYAIGSSRQGR